MKPRRPGAALGAALAVLAAGCASAGGEGGMEDVVGCYQFEVNADTRALGLPWGVELLEDALEGWPALEGAREAVTRLTATERADHPFGFWQPLGTDSVRVGHPGGGGFVLSLMSEGQDLVGTGRAAGDALAPGEAAGVRQSRPVVARRVLCPEAGTD